MLNVTFRTGNHKCLLRQWLHLVAEKDTAAPVGESAITLKALTGVVSVHYSLTVHDHNSHYSKENIGLILRNI